jgi:cytochrome P450
LTIHNWHLDKILFHKIAIKRAQYMAYSKSQAMQRTKLGADTDRRDFFYHLLNAKDPETGAGFTPDELWGESNLFIIAGSDTTSTAMAATIFYLSHNLDALTRAQAEVRSAFHSKEIVHGTTLTGCTFLRACIDEAMRLSPPVPGALPRRVLPGGLDVDGHFIPADVDVCVPHYALHRNAAYFSDPSRYDPTRWLVENPPTEAFAPFSVGPRGCIGKGMAYVELTVSLGKMLWQYDLRLTPGTHAGEGIRGTEPGRNEEETYQLRDTFTSMKDGPIVQFRRRV